MTLSVCPLCGGEPRLLYGDMEKSCKTHFFGVNRPLSIRRCKACKTAFTSPQLSSEELAPYYSEEYRSFQVRKHVGLFSRLATFVKRLTLNAFRGYGLIGSWARILYPFSIPLAHFPRFVAGGKVLDIGCGSGNFLASLAELGWEAHGIDPSAVAVRVAHERGLKNVREGYVENAGYPYAHFDAIVMFHVFEHVANPRVVLKEIRRILKPGGELVIGVPHFGGLASFLYGRWWAGLSFPLHYFHYERKTLLRLLYEEGFETERVSYANLLSDIFISSPESIHAITNDYREAPFGRQFFAVANRLFATLDYCLGNIIAQVLRMGSQITVSTRPAIRAEK